MQHVEAATKTSKCYKTASINRLKITDSRNNTKFLIDTGADVSVIPKSLRTTTLNQTNMQLYAANGTNIKVYGETVLTLDLGLRRRFSWKFIIADVNSCILGADFIKHYGLLIDVKRKRLIDNSTNIYTNCEYSSTPGKLIKTFDSSLQIPPILEEYVDITIPQQPGSPTKTSVMHRIETSGQPVFSRPRRLSPEKLQAAKNEIDELLRLGICRQSSSC